MNDSFPSLAPHLFAAPAKLNLFLDVLDRRADGYHDVRLVNVSISLVDFLRIESGVASGLVFSCNWPFLPTDERNLVVRAVQLLLGDRFGAVSLRIHLHKTIPIGAGLGGGSADAGVTLVWLNDLLDLGFRRGQLLALARQLGSDVPYSVISGAALVEGTGERVTPLSPATGSDRGIELPVWLLVVSPGIAISTAAAYALLDKAGTREHPSPQEMIDALRREDAAGVCSRLYNAFEPVIRRAYPPVGEALDLLETLGAQGRILAGSGSHVVGFFTTVNDVCAAQDACTERGIVSYIAKPRSWPWAPEETCYPIAQELSAQLS